MVVCNEDSIDREQIYRQWWKLFVGRSDFAKTRQAKIGR